MAIGIDTDGLEEKLRSLGFTENKRTGLGMAARIQDMELTAIENPINGLSLTFTSIGPQRICQFEVFAPASATTQQVAEVICRNLEANFRK